MANQMARSFKDLLVWRKAHALVLAIYRYSALFPKSETFGLSGQLRRAAVSIAANIVEGFRRRNATEKARFYNVAQASLDESHYFLILAHDLGYGDTADLIRQLEEVQRLLDSYANSIRATNPNKQR